MLVVVIVVGSLSQMAASITMPPHDPSLAQKNVTEEDEIGEQVEESDGIPLNTSSAKFPDYPESLSSYKHPSRACSTSWRDNVSVPTLFINETRIWENVPDARLMGNSEHERCHHIMRRQLLILTAVMRELNLTSHWFVSHGTLLGALRHGGFIPWDVDVDVVMPRNYITKLRQEWRKYFPRDMFLQTEKTEASFHMWVGKERGVRLKDRYSTFSGMRYTFWSKGKKYKQKKWHLGAHIDVIPLQRMGAGKFKLLHHFFEYDELFPTQSACFEDIEVPVPANLTYFMKTLYGDTWRTMPNKTFGGATTLPCKATFPSAGTAWSLSWSQDWNGTHIKQSPREDPYGSYAADVRRPY